MKTGFITFEERLHLEKLLKQYLSFTDIANVMKRDISTINNEYQKNKNPDGSYTAKQAEKRKKERFLQGKIKRKVKINLKKFAENSEEKK